MNISNQHKDSTASRYRSGSNGQLVSRTRPTMCVFGSPCPDTLNGASQPTPDTSPRMNSNKPLDKGKEPTVNPREAEDHGVEGFGALRVSYSIYKGLEFG